MVLALDSIAAAIHGGHMTQTVLREDGQTWANATLVEGGLYGVAEDTYGETALIALARDEWGIYFEPIAILGKFSAHYLPVALELARAVAEERLAEDETSIVRASNAWHDHRYPLSPEGTPEQRDAASLAFLRRYLKAA